VDALENPVRRGAVKPAALLLPALVASAAIWVFAGAAGFGFSQDDFAALARAAGLLPRFTEPWRWLALQGQRGPWRVDGRFAPGIVRLGRDEAPGQPVL
jgi:hypothetical protein